jgi:hypothetical protein
MPTDWKLIRDLTNAAIDACEATDRLALTEEDRALSTGPASVFDVMTSAWIYPEHVRYAIIRARHDLRDDAPYMPELARVLHHVAEACGELVGLTRIEEARVDGPVTHSSIRAEVERLTRWYRDVMVAQLAHAAAQREAAPDPPA